MNSNVFGTRLRQLREERNISLRDLAKKVGVSAPFLSDIELGRRFPAPDKLELIAREIGVPVDEFKALDFRSEAETIKKLMFADPEAGMVFRTLARQMQQGRSAKDIISKLREEAE
jgi:transcriptional regulator with XRE-family HTH domain